MPRESPNYDDRGPSQGQPAESHERTTDRPSETSHSTYTSDANKIVSDTRSQIDTTVPGVLKKD